MKERICFMRSKPRCEISVESPHSGPKFRFGIKIRKILELLCILTTHYSRVLLTIQNGHGTIGWAQTVVNLFHNYYYHLCSTEELTVSCHKHVFRWRCHEITYAFKYFNQIITWQNPLNQWTRGLFAIASSLVNSEILPVRTINNICRKKTVAVFLLFNILSACFLQRQLDHFNASSQSTCTVSSWILLVYSI